MSNFRSGTTSVCGCTVAACAGDEGVEEELDEQVVAALKEVRVAGWEGM